MIKPSLNPVLGGMGPSATVAINELSNRLRASGKRIYKLGLGQSPFPVPDSVVAALRSAAAEKDYLPVAGLAALRTSVANFHRRHEPNLIGDAGDVLVGPGSKELMFILQLVHAGELLLPSPAWVSYAPQARIVQRPVRWIETERAASWRMDPAKLDAVCADLEGPAVLLLTYPSNPTGGSYDANALEAIADVAKRRDLIILSDEIYGELHHEGQHVSIGRFHPEGTIVSSGLSKWCGAGGWRLGTFFFPPQLAWLREAMAVVASETFTSTSAPIQHAAVRAFDGGSDIEDYLHRSRRVLKTLGGAVHQRLASVGVDSIQPEGAFYLLPSFEGHRARLKQRGITDSPSLCAKLLEDTGVAILPGSDFGHEAGRLTTRLAYVEFDGKNALAANDVMAACTPVLEAIDEICNWIA